MSTKRVAIIGAGVSGLTCGVVLRERRYEVEVLAETDTMETTSAVAAAIWYPYHVGDEADDAANAAVDVWARTSYRRFKSLSAHPKKTGVSMIDFHVVSRNYIPSPGWEVPRPRRLLDDELRQPYRSGFVVNVPVMETPIYLPYLIEMLGSKRIRRSETIEHLDDVDKKFQVIVNCCGIHGPRLSDNDQSLMRPGRGVIVYGKSTLDHAFLDADDDKKEGKLTYIVPRRENKDCVFGGSDDPVSNWDTETTPGERNAIVDRCKNIDPRLEAGEPRVGLRPLRAKGVRLGREEIDKRTVIHNYGHGGAGLTLSWGCAEDVADLVEEALRH
jgi:D-amino-acid oxidase